jgi:hypothetical protein
MAPYLHPRAIPRHIEEGAMLRVACGLVAVLVVGSALGADDKKDDKDKPKLSGTWVREVEGFEVKFQFPKADQLKVTVMTGGNGAVVTAKYETDKDGVIKATVTEVEEKGEFPAKPAKGFEFSFKFKIDGKKASLSDFDGKDAENAKPVVEGEYQKKDD